MKRPSLKRPPHGGLRMVIEVVLGRRILEEARILVSSRTSEKNIPTCGKIGDEDRFGHFVTFGSIPFGR